MKPRDEKVSCAEVEQLNRKRIKFEMKFRFAKNESGSAFIPAESGYEKRNGTIRIDNGQTSEPKREETKTETQMDTRVRQKRVRGHVGAHGFASFFKSGSFRTEEELIHRLRVRFGSTTLITEKPNPRRGSQKHDNWNG